ncbi:unnamed protein product, partial [marine sediment metagenome]
MYKLLEDPIKMHEVFKYLRDQEYLRFLDIDELIRCSLKNDMLKQFLDDYQTIQNIEKILNISLFPSTKLDNENPIKSGCESIIHGIY